MNIGNLILNNRDQFISSYNFARNSDFVFSETLTIAQFNSEFAGNENIEILNSDDNLITFQQRNIYLKENDVIFCNSSRIELLFYYLSKLKLKKFKVNYSSNRFAY